MEDLKPHGPMETRLVERLAQIDLRLNRAIRMETTHLDISARRVFESMGKSLPDDDARTRDSWLVTLAFLHNPAASKLIGQSESRLSRDFARTLSQLKQAQKLRVQEEAQKLRDQSQPIAMPTRNPVGNGWVAPTAEPLLKTDTSDAQSNAAPSQASSCLDENFANQTQPPAPQASIQALSYGKPETASHT